MHIKMEKRHLYFIQIKQILLITENKNQNSKLQKLTFVRVLIFII